MNEALIERLKTVDVTVVSIWSKQRADSQPVIYTVSVARQDSDEDMLEEAFRQSNRVDGTEQIVTKGIPAPSTSIGDIMILGGVFYMVAPCGYDVISEADYDKARTSLTSRDFSLGYKFAKEKGLI